MKKEFYFLNLATFQVLNATCYGYVMLCYDIRTRTIVMFPCCVCAYASWLWYYSYHVGKHGLLPWVTFDIHFLKKCVQILVLFFIYNAFNIASFLLVPNSFILPNSPLSLRHTHSFGIPIQFMVLPWSHTVSSVQGHSPFLNLCVYPITQTLLSSALIMCSPL